METQRRLCLAFALTIVTVLQANRAPGSETAQGRRDPRSTPDEPNWVVQTVHTESSAYTTLTGTIPWWDDTRPQITEGSEIYALRTAIAPINASHCLDIEAMVNVTVNAGHVVLALFRNGAPDAIAAVKAPLYYEVEQLLLRKRVEARSTLPQTFTLRIGSGGDATTQYINGGASGRLLGGALTSFLRVTEIRCATDPGDSAEPPS